MIYGLDMIDRPLRIHSVTESYMFDATKQTFIKFKDPRVKKAFAFENDIEFFEFLNYPKQIIDNIYLECIEIDNILIDNNYDFFLSVNEYPNTKKEAKHKQHKYYKLNLDTKEFEVDDSKKYTLDFFRLPLEFKPTLNYKDYLEYIHKYVKILKRDNKINYLRKIPEFIDEYI